MTLFDGQIHNGRQELVRRVNSGPFPTEQSVIVALALVDYAKAGYTVQEAQVKLGSSVFLKSLVQLALAPSTQGSPVYRNQQYVEVHTWADELLSQPDWPTL